MFKSPEYIISLVVLLISIVLLIVFQKVENNETINNSKDLASTILGIILFISFVGCILTYHN